MNEQQKKRLAELLQLRKDGGLSATELKELGELQELEKASAPITLSADQVNELIEAGVAKAVEGIETEVKELQAENSKMVHGGAVYRSPEPGKMPEVPAKRKGEIGTALRDFILSGEKKALTELTDASGGVLIPVEFRDSVIFYAGIYGIARRLCNYSPMASATQQIDAIANEAIGYFVNEDEDSTESDVTFDDFTLEAKELAVLVTASRKFVQDLKDSRGIDVYDMLAKLFAKAKAKKEDDQFLNGTGAPFVGVFGSADVPAVVMPATKTSMADIAYDDLVKLTRKVPQEHKKGYKPVFMMSEDAMAYCELIRDNDNSLVYKRGDGGEPDRLMGYTVEISDLAPGTAEDAASVSFIAFGDPQHCSFGDREHYDMDIHTSGTVGGVNLITKRRVGIQSVEQIAITIHNPSGFAKLTTAAA